MVLKKFSLLILFGLLIVLIGCATEKECTKYTFQNGDKDCCKYISCQNGCCDIGNCDSKFEHRCETNFKLEEVVP
jgi:hypothetical protein